MATLFVCDRCGATATKRTMWSFLKTTGARPGNWDLCRACMAVVAAVLDQGKDTPDKDDDRSRAKLSAAEVETLEHIWKAAAATDQDAVG